MDNIQNNEQINYEPQFTNISAPCENLTIEKESRSFLTLESVFAWLSLLAGYLFCRAFPANSNPLGATLFIIALFVAATIVLKVRQTKIPLLSIIAAVSAIVISLTLILSGNAFLNFFAFSYALIVYFYFVYSSTGNSLKRGFSNFILIDFIKALFVLPFSSMGLMFKAMFSSRSGKKLPLKIIAGLGIALIPTGIVLSLLSYDSSFLSLWNSIFKIDYFNLFSHIGSLLLGIPIGMYIFGSFLSCVDNNGKDILTVESCRKASKSLKKIPVLTAVFATAPVLFVYIIFFISQWRYYISGFTGKLPENLSYAEYAREGFFQLCAVSVINLILIVSVFLLMRRTDDEPPIALKILALLFSAFTLILISTALAKMVMYIDCYGLTQKRIYATWLMAVLALIFVFIAIQQIAPKLKTVAISFVVVVALFAVLCLSNVNGTIAKYNVKHYISGDLQTVDVSALSELGDAAVPELVNLYEYTQEKLTETGKITKEDFNLRSNIKSTLERFEMKYSQKDKTIYSFNLPRHRAEKAIENWRKYFPRTNSF